MGAHAEQFRHDGWTVLDQLFAPAECDEILAELGARTYPQMTPALLAWATDERWVEPVIDVLDRRAHV